ncbi:hypothetical protein DSL92_05865 [Billgrantia gudaonensis]|uniref:Uncharacterized protein n=1 Tax=Billgrantia gudaonensis TaxID=376427 RepID=A0A3S0NDZ8_9GAMM|nr:hypothetical protein DSL92_05865 [Halomonas gudaonensis]
MASGLAGPRVKQYVTSIGELQRLSSIGGYEVGVADGYLGPKATTACAIPSALSARLPRWFSPPVARWNG